MFVRYLARRLLHALLALWGAVTLAFLVIHLVPGDPVRIMLGVGDGSNGGASATTAQIAGVRHQLGLDQPLPIQYLDFLRNAVTLNFGMSYSARRPVSQVILNALPATAQLAVCSVALAVLLGFAFAILARLMPSRFLGSLFQSVTVFGVAVPSFWVGIVLLQIFSFTLHWFPAFGSNGLASLVLPSFTLALVQAGTLAQVLGRGLDEALVQQWADAARAKGASPVRVLLAHALRNGSLPVFTLVGMMVGSMLAGTTIVETVFGRDGLGNLIVTAISARDFPLIQALVMLSGALFVLVTLVVDLAYRWIDPRIAADYETSGGGA